MRLTICAASATISGNLIPLRHPGLPHGLVATAESLADFSERGRPVSGKRRELVVVWPYIIRYRIEADRIVILRVRHGARHPLP